MTAITSSLSTYATGFTFAGLKVKAQKLSQRFIGEHAPPHESAIRMIVRRAFEALSAIIMMSTGLIALIPLSAGFALHRFFQPASFYTIQNPKGYLSKTDILAHLRYLKASGTDIETIEFRPANNTSKIEFDDEMITLLKEIDPFMMILPSTTDPELAQKFETVDCYYTKREIKAKPGRSQCCLERKEKINCVVVPPEPEAAVEKLQKLVDAKERVTNLYFTRVVPRNMERQITELVSQLHPSLELLIDNKNKLSPQALEALLNN